MLTILLTLTLAHAIKDGLDDEQRRLLCSGALVASVSTTNEGAPVVLVYRQEHGFSEYRRTDRDFFDGHGYMPLEKVFGERYLNRKRMDRKSVLDAGCGGGSFVQYLRSLGANAHGLDLELSPLQACRPDLFTKADMSATGLADESFDYIFSSFSVFYYEPENYRLLQQILSEFARLLKPGGMVLLGGNPARALAPIDLTARYLREGYAGHNDYVERLLGPDSPLRPFEAGGERLVLIKPKGPFWSFTRWRRARGP